MSDNGNSAHTSVVEALILASPEPLAARKVAEMMDDFTPGQVGKAVADLNTRYYESGSSYRIREIAGGFQFYILPEFTGYVDEMFTRRRKMRLTRAALETLAIIAYRQPVTKTDIEQIRGVASDGVIHNLLEKEMVTIKGRANTVGRPLQYGTTDEFLKFFGLNKLGDLPKMKEIEELIRAAEPQSDEQLNFGPKVLDTEKTQKLNVADGTFDPFTRDSYDEDGSDDSYEEDESSDEEDGSRDEVDSDDEDASDDDAETEEPSATVIELKRGPEPNVGGEPTADSGTNDDSELNADSKPTVDDKSSVDSESYDDNESDCEEVSPEEREAVFQAEIDDDESTREP